MLSFYFPVNRLEMFRIDVSTPISTYLFADVRTTFGLGETRRIFGPTGVTGNIVRITNHRFFAGTESRTLTLCEVKVYGDYGKTDL